MRSLLKSIFIWLLVMALPIQGYAATTMAACQPGHHGQEESTAAPHEHATHLVGALEVSTHDHQTHPGGIHEQSLSGAAGVETADTGHGGTKCSACASCCYGAALMASAPAHPCGASTADLNPAEFVSIARFITGGPERPPRPFLA